MHYRPLDVLLSEYGMNGKGIDADRALVEAREQIDSANGHPGPVVLNIDGLVYTMEYRGLCTDENRRMLGAVVTSLRDYAESMGIGFKLEDTRTMRKDWNPIALEYFG
jgi:hypothetical protein